MYAKGYGPLWLFLWLIGWAFQVTILYIYKNGDAEQVTEMKRRLPHTLKLTTAPVRLLLGLLPISGSIVQEAAVWQFSVLVFAIVFFVLTRFVFFLTPAWLFLILLLLTIFAYGAMTRM